MLDGEMSTKKTRLLTCGGNRNERRWSQTGALDVLRASNLGAKPVSGKAASLHAGSSGDIVTINNLRSRLSQVVPRLIRLNPLIVIILGLVLYVAVAFVFALSFWWCGAGCFDVTDGEDFTFVEMLWLSVHTFSTVGFGSIFPTCTAGQVLVLVESYISLLVQAVVGAYVVFIFMRSRAKIRFSKNCLVSGAASAESSCQTGEYASINIRLVRESYTQVRDAHVYLQAHVLMPEAALAEHSSKSFHESATGSDRRVELETTSAQMSSLEHWEVCHVVNKYSPLWSVRAELPSHLKAIDVSLSAYDTAFNQPVKLYVHYQKEEISYDCHFDPMTSTSADGSVTTVDHAKLDAITKEEIVPKGMRDLRKRRSCIGTSSLSNSINVGGALFKRVTRASAELTDDVVAAAVRKAEARERRASRNFERRGSRDLAHTRLSAAFPSFGRGGHGSAHEQRRSSSEQGPPREDAREESGGRLDDGLRRMSRRMSNGMSQLGGSVLRGRDASPPSPNASPTSLRRSPFGSSHTSGTVLSGARRFTADFTGSATHVNSRPPRSAAKPAISSSPMGTCPELQA